jgi:molecular chaperone DnaJ
MTKLNQKTRGDLFVEISVETPVNLSARQKELLKEFCAAGGEDCNPSSSGFFRRAKKFWDGLGVGDIGFTDP